MDKPKFGDTALYLAISWGAAFGFFAGFLLSGSGAIYLTLIVLSLLWAVVLTIVVAREVRFPERFSIRDLLWLTVVVALAVGFSLERWNRNNERVEYEQRLDASSRHAQELQGESAYLRNLLKHQAPAPNPSKP